MKSHGPLPVALCLMASIFMVSCDEPFQATEINDRYFFSMYGYLDAAADTQWVRIMPIRDSILTDSDPVDAVVTLRHLETGETVIMRDSLFRYGPNTYAWNYWTTKTLEPSQTYRLKAERSDGRQSYADITIPDDYTTPLFWAERVGVNVVEIRGIERLMDVQIAYTVESLQSGATNTIFVPQLEDTVRLITGNYQVRFNPILNEEIIKDSYPNSRMKERQIFVAVSTLGTPHFPSISRNIFALPEGVRNVVDGVGYVAGILSKTIPYKTCYEGVDLDIMVPCPLEPPPWQLRLNNSAAGF